MRRIRTRWALGAIGTAVVATFLLSFKTVHIPKPSAPLPIPTAARPIPFPHMAFDAVLREVVDARGRVDYVALAARRSALERYLYAVAATSPHSDPAAFPTRADALAYWLNAYNAAVLYGVITRPGLRSVRDARFDFFGFSRSIFGGEALSLHGLENDVIRAHYHEPRVHFALNCASVGCPELPREAFLPDRLEAQLARETRAFCAHPDKVYVRDGIVHLSQIFDWYAEDFAAAGGPIAFCRRWGRSDLPADAELRFIPYDWSLNAQPGRHLTAAKAEARDVGGER